jgi:hypothetical protein
MQAYRCYFLDDAGHIRAVEVVTGEDQKAAVDAAVSLHKARPGYGFIELWDRTKLIYSSEHEYAS